MAFSGVNAYLPYLLLVVVFNIPKSNSNRMFCLAYLVSQQQIWKKKKKKLEKLEAFNCDFEQRYESFPVSSIVPTLDFSATGLVRMLSSSFVLDCTSHDLQCSRL